MYRYDDDDDFGDGGFGHYSPGAVSTLNTLLHAMIAVCIALYVHQYIGNKNNAVYIYILQ